MPKISFTKTKKIVASVLISSMIFMNTAPVACAGYWGENFGANIMQVAIEEMKKAYHAMILKSLKSAANRTIRNSVRKLVAGTMDEVMVIADYEEFIFGSAGKNSDSLVTDFFRGVLRDASRQTRKEIRMVERVLRNEIESNIPAIDFQVDYHINSPTPRSDIFRQSRGGGTKPYLVFQMGGEHPLDVYLTTQAALAEKARREQESNLAKAVAGQGFNSPTDKDGNIVPGSVVQEVMAKAETMDLDTIANATNWQEVVAGLATAAVTSLVRNGVRVVSKPINNAVRDLERSVDRGTDNLLDELYGSRR